MDNSFNSRDTLASWNVQFIYNGRTYSYSFSHRSNHPDIQACDRQKNNITEVISKNGFSKKKNIF